MPLPGKVLITGASGYLGRPLCARLGADRVVPLYNRVPIHGGYQFDALKMKLEQVIRPLDGITHGVIFHADSNPNACSEDIERSDALNIDSAKSVVDSFVEMGVKPVFASSEAVFGQDGKGPYAEHDIPIPAFAYGRQKVTVEDYIRSCAADHLIVRIARVIGSDDEDLTGFEEWLRKIERGEAIRCAADQIMSPACLNDAVEGVARLIERDCRGTYHLPGQRPIMRIELLQLLIKEVSKLRAVDVAIEKCSLHDFPVLEKRPLNSTMDATKLIAETGIELTPYEVICQRMARRLQVGNPEIPA